MPHSASQVAAPGWLAVARRGASGAAMAAGIAFVGLGACRSASTAPGGGALAIVLESDMSIPKDIDHVTLEVTQEGQSLLHVDSVAGAGALLIPATFQVKSTGNQAPVAIQAVAYKNGQPRVERDAVTPIPANRVGELQIALNYLCVGSAQADADGGVSSTCTEGLTCVDGSCTTSVVPPADVPTVSPAATPGSDDASADAGVVAGGCFDVATCFASATPAVVDTASCVVTLPAGTDDTMVNVALQFPLGGPGVCGLTSCWVSLTGWAANGTQLQLPTAACQMAASQGATLSVSTACSTESDGAPLCGPWSPVSIPAQEPPPMHPGPLGMACTGPTEQACGMCGTQSRTCEQGTWSPWGACTAEGACTPAATQSCGTGGTETCGADCQWGACACPSGQLACGTPVDCVSPADVHTCGSCSNDCTSLPHVAGPTTCSAGSCAFPLSSCAPGWGDCNGDPTDGCETPLNTVAHCGSCAAAACSGVDAVCDTTTSPAKCGNNCTGAICGSACVNTATDPTHCGGCTTTCATPAHGQAACAGGKCGVVCNAGYTACGESCVDVTSDAANCGACAHACPQETAPAVSTCVSGACTCPGAASQACGDCGTQTRTCGNGVWSAWSACTGQGTCAVGATKTCDGNGTETCSSACAWGACACNAGYTLCGGTCVSEQTDATNCGACGNTCVSGVACSSGVCTCSTSTGCGNCGTMTRTCSADGTASAWSACSNEGPCTSPAVQSCAYGSETGTQTCTSSCQWDTCCYPGPFQVVSAGVVVDTYTGLSWTRSVSILSTDAAAQAATCAAMGSGWSLPTAAQAIALVSDRGPSNTCAFRITLYNAPSGANYDSSNACVLNCTYTSDGNRVDLANGQENFCTQGGASAICVHP